MNEQETIQKLLSLGFKDESYWHYKNGLQPVFNLDVNESDLRYENGKFTLEGNGGYDYAGELELDHLQIEDIKPLYKLLTGKPLQEVVVSFDYKEWEAKLKKDQEQRQENFRNSPLYGLMSDTTKFPGKDLPFLDFLKDMSSKEQPDKFVWSERKNLNND